MTSDEELRTVAETLGRELLVTGTGDLAAAVRDRARSDPRDDPPAAVDPDGIQEPAPVDDSSADRIPVPSSSKSVNPSSSRIADHSPSEASQPPATRTVRALVIAVDHTAPDPGAAIARAASDARAFAVAVLGVPSDGTVDPGLLAAVREAADATILVSRSHPIAAGQAADDPAATGCGPETAGSQSAAAEPAVEGAFAFVQLLRTSGFVNLDLADARTILGAGPLAGLGHGAASLADLDGHEAAVVRAFDAMPTGIELARAPGVLVSLVGDPTMSITDVSAALTAVRERVGSGVHVIWGGAVDEALAGELHVRVVVADVAYVPTPTPGDPCPRCGATVSTYTFGETTTLSCDGCGFADVAVSFE